MQPLLNDEQMERSIRLCHVSHRASPGEPGLEASDLVSSSTGQCLAPSRRASLRWLISFTRHSPALHRAARTAQAWRVARFGRHRHAAGASHWWPV